MQITKENYELFIIDYLDGKLDSEEKQALMAFVEANLEVKEEFELLKTSSDLTSESELEMPDFSFLKQENILDEELIADEILIAKIEGDLNKRQLFEFDKMIDADPIKQKSLKLYLSTISNPDLTIQFPNKDSLKRGTLKIQYFNYKRIASIAAAAALFAIAGFVIQNQFNPNLSAYHVHSASGNAELNLTDNLSKINKLQPIKNIPNSSSEATEIANLSKVSSSRINLLKEQEIQSNLHLLTSKSASIEQVKIIFNEIPQQVFPVYNSSGNIAYNPAIDEFKTPGKWLIEKAKNMKQVQPILKTDSLIRNTEVGNVAINILNQTPGIIATAKTDEDGHNRGFAIMSRYFSIERSY